MENRCCVKCDSVLDRGQYAGVDVDLCPTCGGLWLDRGEIQKLAAAPATQVQELRKLLGGDAKQKPVPSDVPTACPACTGKLKEVVLGPVRVDYCLACKGMWLDRGELDAAITATRGRASAAAIVQVAAQAMAG